jgi:large subunit ribosomal protein L25
MAKKEIPVLNVSYRPESGKNAMRRIRKAGGTPGIIFGRSGHTTPITFTVRDLEIILQEAKKGLNTMFQIKVTGEKEEEIPLSMIKDYQLEPVSHDFLHVSFFRVHTDRMMEFHIPVITEGTAHGVKEQGGHMELIQREATVECLPTDVPVNFVVDVTEMTIGDTITAADLDMPEGVKYVGEPDDPIVTVVTTRLELEAEEEEEEEELEEGEVPEGEEGEEGEGEEGEEEEE